MFMGDGPELDPTIPPAASEPAAAAPRAPRRRPRGPRPPRPVQDALASPGLSRRLVRALEAINIRSLEHLYDTPAELLERADRIGARAFVELWNLARHDARIGLHPSGMVDVAGPTPIDVAEPPPGAAE